MLVQTIYESRARARITDVDIAEITTTALPGNLTNGVTGFMYYDDWRFLHILEGRPEQIADTMQRIAVNPLHSNLKILLMNRSTTRQFVNWPFGTVSAGDLELCRTVKNMGYQDLFHANVLVCMKVLRRVARRKYRTMSTLDKRALSDPRKVIRPKPEPSLTEAMLGLHG